MKNKAEKPKRKKFKPIHEGRSEWPVVQLARNRKEFIEMVKQGTIRKVKESCTNHVQLIEELELTLYRERQRIQENPWKVDPDDERLFWSKVKSALVEIGPDDPESKLKTDALLEQIVDRYANEIAGNFKSTWYSLTREIVKFGFARLLNVTRVKRFGAFFRNEYSLQDKIQITGHRKQIRKLAQKGTVVMVPTHFSNLDSILIGWVIHVLGLPPFIYGAGLNLFNIKILAYFMNSLGAYKVDRRKKHMIYLETLKMYSTLALQKGAHSLFFPGGTRSRSGKIESELKLGLLGTALEAQRINLMEKPDERGKKIFVVPVVINYNFVLEAPALINEHLKREGQERYYIESDEYSTSYKMVSFLLKFFTKGSDISLSIGKAMDLWGNYVDEEGNSLDNSGRVLDISHYFIENGKMTIDKQREVEYTRMLGDRIVQEFHRHNRVFASHLVAFIAFQYWRKKFPGLDLFNFLRIPEEELLIPYEEFKIHFRKVRKRVFKLKKKNKVNVAQHLKGDLDEVIKIGIENVGMYHAKRPLHFDKAGNIITQDLNTLYFYHNRMDGYDLEKYFKK